MNKEKKSSQTAETETCENLETETPDCSEETETKNDECAELKAKYDELYDKYIRMLAEYDNYKKRTQKEKDELYSTAICDTIEKLLPVVDNLERAIDTQAEETPFYSGVCMILKQLEEIFSKLDIETIEAIGKEFDPLMHNAVMHIDDETKKDGEIVEQFAKGYKRKDKIIRYSMVKVAN